MLFTGKARADCSLSPCYNPENAPFVFSYGGHFLRHQRTSRALFGFTTRPPSRALSFTNCSMLGPFQNSALPHADGDADSMRGPSPPGFCFTQRPGPFLEDFGHSLLCGFSLWTRWARTISYRFFVVSGHCVFELRFAAASGVFPPVLENQSLPLCSYNTANQIPSECVSPLQCPTVRQA